MPKTNHILETTKGNIMNERSTGYVEVKMAATTPDPHLEIDSIIDRIQMLTEIVADATSRLEIVADRLVGVQPDSVKENGDQTEPCGAIYVVSQSLDILEEKIRRLNPQVQRIAGL